MIILNKIYKKQEYAIDHLHFEHIRIWKLYHNLVEFSNYVIPIKLKDLIYL